MPELSVLSSGTATRRRSEHASRAAAPAIALLCLAILVVADLLIGHEHGITGDEPYYSAMARHPGGTHTFPYAYRVVVPWLVHVLPLREVVAFTVIGFAAMAISGGALYALMRDLRVPPVLAAWLTVGYILSPTLLVVLVRHCRSIDPASMLVMTLGTLFIVRRQRVALLATLTIGAGVRESALFLIPLAYVVWARGPIDGAALRDVVLTCLIPLVVFVALRTQIHTAGRQYVPGYQGSFLHGRWTVIREAFTLGTLKVELRRLAYTYGPLWLIAPFALRDMSFARRGLALVALCVISMTFAFDWGRIIFLAAPVFFPAAGWVLADRRRLAIAAVVALLAVDVGYGVYLQVHGIKHGLDSSVSHVPVY